MKLLHTYFLILAIVCLARPVHSQLEYSQWYFGTQAGMGFLTTPPTNYTNGMLSTSEGCASLADASGNLLLYTDGSTIYNKLHAVMSNGAGLNGNASTTQAAVIVRLPGSSTLYYVFSLSAGNNCTLNYSIVDMSLSAGNGSVTTKNVTIATMMTEKMTAVKHCNGVDYWILSHTYQSNDFRCFLLTSSGITNTVVSAAGSVLTGASYAGNMKVSPNGKKVGVATYNANTYELFDFDASTGVVSNPITLPMPGTGNTYGCEFSPDGTKFFGTKELGTNSNAIYQWDLCAGSGTAIAASVFTIATTSQVTGMQIGIDGKIYVSRWGQQWLGVIDNPNVYGIGFNYTHNGFSLSPKTAGANLPNFMVSGFKSPPPPFTFTVSNAFGCQTASFTAPFVAQNFTQSACSAQGYSLTGLQWIFGDPASGSANTSTLTNPSHAFTGLGTYTTQLVFYYSCGGGSDTIKQTVIINQPCISVSSTSITCANLGSATVQATGGIGPYSYTWMPTAQTTSVATGLSPGNYTLTVFDFGNNFTYTAQTAFTSLIPLTASFSFADSVSCFGANTATGAISNITGGSSSQTFSWFNGISNYTTAFTNSLSAGVWSATVTDALTGCIAKQTFFIQQPTARTLSLSASSPSACAGGSIVLNASTGGGVPGYTYTWTNGPAATSYTVSENTGGPFHYTLSSRDAKHCLVSGSITVTFVNPPVISVSNVTVCPQVFGTLTANGASTYTWNNSNQNNVLIDNPNVYTTYTVYGSSLGCSSSATASINYFQAPVAGISMAADICENRSLTLTGSGGNSYAWSGPSAFASSAQSPLIQSASLNHNGQYTLLVTSAQGCTATASASLQVHPTPTLTAIGSTVCIGQALLFSASSFPSAAYSWKGPLNFSSTAQNPLITSGLVSHSGIYTVNVTSAANCTNSALINAQVVPPPSLTLSLSSQTLCAQPSNGSLNTITLTASGAASYTFVTGTDLNNPNPSGPASSLSPVAPYYGISSATVFGSNGVCTQSATTSFSVIPNPTILVTANPAVCAGESFTYTNQGAATYTWKGPLGILKVSNSGAVAVASPLATSIFSVLGQSQGCFSDTRTSTITVKPLPTLIISPLHPTVCLHRSTQLNASGTAATYIWPPAPGLINGSGPVVNVSPLSQQVYTVTGELNNCYASTTTTVIVRSLPEPTISITKDSYCQNEKITLTGEGGGSYEWRGPSNFYDTKKTISYQPGIGMLQWSGGVYSLTVRDGNGCEATATKQITVYDMPQGTLMGLTAGCIPLCSEYLFHPNGSNSSGSWTINGQNFSDQFNYCFTDAGTYTISGTITDKTTACENHQVLVITAYANPVADFNFLPLHPIENTDEVKFTNTSTGQNVKNWDWHFINNSGNQSQEENISFLFKEEGEYPVALVVTDENDCQDTVVKKVKVEVDFTIYIPDAFTPNGDGLNDVFLPVVRGSHRFVLSVFDRWGKRVFYSTSLDSGWDGTFMGTACKVDIYNYQLIVSTASGEKKECTGHVSLVR